MIDPNIDQIFLRLDLDKAPQRVAFYRLTEDLRDFLNTCREKNGEIEAIILTKKDDDSGRYDWNIGFVLPERREQKLLRNKKI